MYDEYIKQLRKRVKGLTIAVIVLAILLFIVTIICVSDFEIAVEYADNYNVDQSADGYGGGEGSSIEQSGVVAQDHHTVIICITVIAGLAIVIAGVLIYAYIRKKNTELQCAAISQFRKGDIQQDVSIEEPQGDNQKEGTD